MVASLIPSPGKELCKVRKYAVDILVQCCAVLGAC